MPWSVGADLASPFRVQGPFAVGDGAAPTAYVAVVSYALRDPASRPGAGHVADVVSTRHVRDNSATEATTRLDAEAIATDLRNAWLCGLAARTLVRLPYPGRDEDASTGSVNYGVAAGTLLVLGLAAWPTIDAAVAELADGKVTSTEEGLISGVDDIGRPYRVICKPGEGNVVDGPRVADVYMGQADDAAAYARCLNAAWLAGWLW